MEQRTFGPWSPVAGLMLAGIWAAFALALTCLLLFEGANSIFHIDGMPSPTPRELWRMGGTILEFGLLAGIGFWRQWQMNPSPVVVWAYRIGFLLWVGSLAFRVMF